MLRDSMIIQDDLIKELLKLGVGVMRSSIDTNSRVNVLGPGEDRLPESKADLVFLVFVFLP